MDDGDGLKRFMTELAGNVDRLAEFIADPQAAADAAGLSQEAKDALFSGDQARIYMAIGGITMPPDNGTGAQQQAAAAQPPAQGLPYNYPMPQPGQYGQYGQYGCMPWGGYVR